MAFAGLKPNEELVTSALAATLVYGVFQLDAPNLADTYSSKAGNTHVHGSVKAAVWTATALTAGIAILAKSPTVFVVGGLVTVVEAWKFHHANTFEPSTGKLNPAAFGG